VLGRRRSAENKNKARRSLRELLTQASSCNKIALALAVIADRRTPRAVIPPAESSSASTNLGVWMAKKMSRAL